MGAGAKQGKQQAAWVKRGLQEDEHELDVRNPAHFPEHVPAESLPCHGAYVRGPAAATPWPTPEPAPGRVPGTRRRQLRGAVKGHH